MKPLRHSLRPRLTLFLLLVSLLFVPPGVAWQPAAQRFVTAQAIEALPDPLRSFFEAHRQQIIALASDPSQWDAADRKYLHLGYIRLDAYGEFPFPQLPRDYDTAV
ncbi:MAG: hypothetical protein AAB289_02845, partial [Chloroflexota bacterium]